MSLANTFDTEDEWRTQPQTSCARCGHHLGDPLPDLCTYCRHDPKETR